MCAHMYARHYELISTQSDKPGMFCLFCLWTGALHFCCSAPPPVGHKFCHDSTLSRHGKVGKATLVYRSTTDQHTDKHTIRHLYRRTRREWKEIKRSLDERTTPSRNVFNYLFRILIASIAIAGQTRFSFIPISVCVCVCVPAEVSEGIWQAADGRWENAVGSAQMEDDCIFISHLRGGFTQCNRTHILVHLEFNAFLAHASVPSLNSILHNVRAHWQFSTDQLLDLSNEMACVWLDYE